MQKKLLASLVVTAALSLSSAYAADYQAKMIAVDQSKAVKDNYIIVFNTPNRLHSAKPMAVLDFARTQANRLAQQFNFTFKRNFGDILNGALIKATPGQIKKLLKDPSVKYIEQDQIVSLMPPPAEQDQIASVSPLVAGQEANATWGIDRIDQRNLPLNDTYNYDYDGTGVTAYVLDTGIRSTHEEFSGRVSSGWDFVDNDADASDGNGHGTHIAGVIGGLTLGVARNVNIVSVRVADPLGEAFISDIISALSWVEDNAAGPAVINLSILSSTIVNSFDAAVNATVAAGITVVVAAGNQNDDACDYSPGRAVDAITVASSKKRDKRSGFSNYGSCVDIFAPGTRIEMPFVGSDTATNTSSGTSYAAPHVVGVVALYLDEDPSLTPAQIEALLSLRATTDKVTEAAGSPNKLLYSLADGPCGTDCPPPPAQLIQN